MHDSPTQSILLMAERRNRGFGIFWLEYGRRGAKKDCWGESLELRVGGFAVVERFVYLCKLKINRICAW